MTELSSACEALDGHLAAIKDRGMLSIEEVVDILLDIRLLLTTTGERETDGQLQERTAALVGASDGAG